MKLRHLLGIEELSPSDILAIIDRAAALRDGAKAPQVLAGQTVVSLFFEPSTRTRVSFELAAYALGAQVVVVSEENSSTSKGESLLDTVRNIDAMRPRAIIVRHRASGAAATVAGAVKASVVNAGDGQHEHPTQALLDILTLREALGPLDGKSVLIVGDILHSRVARSDLIALRKLNARCVFCGPPALAPTGLAALGAEVTHDFDAALPRADAVIMLRAQRERFSEQGLLPGDLYRERWALTEARAARMKSSAVVLHPGPANRDFEIDSSVADGARSLILRQVTNGGFVRQAVLEALA